MRLLLSFLILASFQAAAVAQTSRVEALLRREMHERRIPGLQEEFIDELAGIYEPEIPLSDPVTALRMELRQRGYEQAIEVFKELKQKNPDFQPLENDLNDWAYRMLNGGGKPKEALEIFKMNVFLYPNSANVYDSVAEAYENGNRKLAITNYKRSLELDPKNTKAAEQLKRLGEN
jgi:tetratricopeptide (TPR) repeat protein